MQENHLALRSEGVKMVVDSMRPHFVGIDPDVFSTGLVFYYLKVRKDVSIMSTGFLLVMATYSYCMCVTVLLLCSNCLQDGPTTIGVRSEHIIPDICECLQYFSIID